MVPLRRGLLTLPLIAQQNVRSEHQAITHTPWRTHYLSGHRMEQPDERDQDRDRDRKAKVNWQVLKVTMKPKNSHFSNSFTVCTHHTHTHLHSHMHSHSHSYSYSFAHSHACTPRWTTTEHLKTLHSKMHATHTHTQRVLHVEGHTTWGRQAGRLAVNTATRLGKFKDLRKAGAVNALIRTSIHNVSSAMLLFPLCCHCHLNFYIMHASCGLC